MCLDSAAAAGAVCFVQWRPCSSAPRPFLVTRRLAVWQRQLPLAPRQREGRCPLARLVEQATWVVWLATVHAARCGSGVLLLSPMLAMVHRQAPAPPLAWPSPYTGRAHVELRGGLVAGWSVWW
ncbi:hypothetical protein E2562_007015 [Oryza meyeriana var. granulata]|uniref:Uncharacterized protein n=1 Tax=Oryza meyeriana var. granulata TaxID=110450 RepID=A0A6G1E8P1_9ORYZ|nr:hypothetical protein E2562_007015 [Oryza meyeriana var. granulata]